MSLQAGSHFDFIILASKVQEYFYSYGYLGIYFWFITVDQLIPVPEEITLIIIGYFVTVGTLNPIVAGACAIAAFLTVDSVYFFLAKSGNKLIKKFTGKLDTPKAKHYKEKLKNNLLKTLIILCFVPRMRLLAPVYVALIKMPYGKFILYDLIGLSTFTSVFISLGIVFHSSLSSVIEKSQTLGNIIFISAILVMTGLTIFIIKKLK